MNIITDGTAFHVVSLATKFTCCDTIRNYNRAPLQYSRVCCPCSGAGCIANRTPALIRSGVLGTVTTDPLSGSRICRFSCRARASASLASATDSTGSTQQSSRLKISCHCWRVFVRNTRCSSSRTRAPSAPSASPWSANYEETTIKDIYTRSESKFGHNGKHEGSRSAEHSSRQINHTTAQPQN